MENVIDHELKCLPKYFQRTWDREKTFEMRIDDRMFREGDNIELREWSVVHNYSGRSIVGRISFIMKDGEGFLIPNFCCFNLVELSNVEVS